MASSTTVQQPADHARQERYRTQRILWRESSLDRVRACGRNMSEGSSGVAIRHTAGPDGSRSAGFAGLQTCGSVWSCAPCNQKIATRRAEELAMAVRLWESIGGRVAFVTLTVQHHRARYVRGEKVSGQTLPEVWDAVSKSWARVTSGKAWEADQERYGHLVETSTLAPVPMPRDAAEEAATALLRAELGAEVTGGRQHLQYAQQSTWKRRIGWVRSVETMVGHNGWHVHTHALVFLMGDVDLDGLAKSMFQRWRKGAQAAGLDAVAAHGGLDYKWIEGSAEAMSTYLSKSTYDGAGRAGWEVAGGAMKDGRRGNRAPFRVLRDLVETGDEADLRLWREWEQGSRGRRQLTWARWFKQWLDVDQQTDEEIAAEELDGETLAFIEADAWPLLRERKADLLRAAETLPLDTLRRQPPWVWLDLLEASQSKLFSP